MQPAQESTSHLPRPQSLAAMSPLGWFAVVLEMVATQSKRARLLECAAPRREVRENDHGSLWQVLRAFARRLVAPGVVPQQGNTIARDSSRECTPWSTAKSVSLATGAERNSSRVPANPRPARDKSVSRLASSTDSRVGISPIERSEKHV